MAGINGLPTALESAVSGIRAGVALTEKGADTVARSGLQGRDQVTVSAAARQPGAASRVREPDLAEGILDVRIGKYVAVANMRVASTAAEVQEEAADIGRRR